MSYFKCFVLFTVLLSISGCGHRQHVAQNEFELADEQDVIPEPIESSSFSNSLKDTGFRYGLSDRFASQETTSWRTKVAHSIISPSKSDWDTSYTHSLKDAIFDDNKLPNPVETYRRTGHWPLQYSLDTGDRLRVIVYSQRTLTRTYSVDDSGHISIPLVGQIYARGSSTKTVSQRISKALSKKYLRDPKVSVEVATYRPFFVLGQVQAAGQFPYVVGMTAEMAVAIGGGFTPRANERKFRVNRVYKGRRYTLLVSRNFPVFPGDTIYVPERFF